MAILTFPASPVNGELYPVTPLPGQNQYQWEQAALTWRLVGTATGVAAGTYGDATNIPRFTVDVTGRITTVTSVPIGSYYVKTNNSSAFNSYVWPNADGTANQFLSTDGAGNLSWVANPFTNYWKLVGSSLEPVSNSYDLLLRDPANDVVFYVDNATGTLELTAPGGVGSSFLQFEPTNAGSIITAAVSATGADPLTVRGSTVSLAAYGNSFLNTPSEVTLTQSALDSSVSISTDGAVTVNAGTANSFTTPPTRGTSGQFLKSNGDGTTTWSTFANQDYWQRTIAGTLSPLFPGDTVEVTTAASIPAIILSPTGKVEVISGLQNLTLNANPSANTTQIVSSVNTNPANLNITGNKVILQPCGSAFANPATTFTVSNPGNLNLTANIGGVDTSLFTVDDSGNMKVGRYIDNLAPALSVTGLNGNVTVGGRLTINAGVPLPGSTNSYTFPGNRGVLNYALFTNADGTTRWDNISNVAGYWSVNGGATEIYPTAAGQNVVIRNSASANSIYLDADGFITSSGGDINNPTYGFAGNKTGLYGGTVAEINVGVNGVRVGKFDTNFFSIYEDIDFVGKSTNPGANSTFENTNTELLFTASSSAAISKDITFENSLNKQVAKFSSVGDFTVNYGNAAIGSTTVATSTTNITLSIGDNAANKAGKLKFYSTYNGGDGAEIYQDPGTGQVFFALNSTTPILDYTATDFYVNANTELGGNLLIDGFLRYPNPFPPPPTSTSVGQAGTITWDSNYIYICISTNQWKRVALSTW